MMLCRPTLIALGLVVVAACAGDSSDDTAITASGARPSTPTTEVSTASSRPTTITTQAPASDGSTGERGEWQPTVGETWQWQLEGDLNVDYDVAVYDIDLFDTPAASIADLKARRVAVVCYFSAGSWEEWRPDAERFRPDVIGETLDGWEDERWLDITDPAVLEVMATRIELAADKGCDAVEPDNVEAYDDATGFQFTSDDQIAFNLALADAAHQRGMKIGLKNALMILPDLEPHFDFSVSEQCWEFDECDMLRPFLDAGKPVFNAEYSERFVAEPDLICDAANAMGMSTLILPLDLDDTYRISCLVR